MLVARRESWQRLAGAAVLLGLLVLLAGPAGAGQRYDRQDGREAALLGAGVAVSAGAVWLGAELTPLSPRELARLDAADLPGWDRPATGLWSPAAATASDVLGYGAVAAPLLLLADTGPGAGAGDLGLMYAQTLLLERGTIGVIKALVRRPRPLAYNPDPRIGDDLRRSRHAVRSFPSGHTAGAFAAAMFAGEVYAHLHPDDPARHWIRAGGLAVAAATGWLRVRAGRHFPSDVLAGAVIGSLIGWAVPRWHEVDAAPERAAGPRPGLVLGFGF
jgi:membrane-associated phospholipid phosphatase